MTSTTVRPAETRSTPRRQRLPLPRLALYIFCTLVLIYLVFPILVVIPLSFSSAQYLTFPPPGFSLQWYRNFFERSDWINAAILSFWVACVVMVLATLLGTLASLALVRGRFPGRGLVNTFIVSPLIVPAIIVAIGVYFFYARLGIVGQPIALITAHTALAVPFVVVNVTATLYGFDERLEFAAMNLGANRLQTFWHVTLPRKMWDSIRFQIDPTIAAVSTLLIIITGSLFFSAEMLRRRSERLRTAVIVEEE